MAINAAINTYWLTTQLPILDDARTMITSRLMAIYRICDCIDVYERVSSLQCYHMNNFQLVDLLNDTRWCIRCLYSTPYTMNTTTTYSNMYIFDNSWLQMDGCICHRLPSAELMGFSTCYELNLHLNSTGVGPRRTGPCRECGLRYYDQ